MSIFLTKQEAAGDNHYEGNAILRMLSYIKPYWKRFVFCILLVVVITVLELYKPILIGDAIDRYIDGYDYPYKIVTETDKDTVIYDGQILKKVDEVQTGTDIYAKLTLCEDSYYFFTNLDTNEITELSQLEKENQIVVQQDNLTCQGKLSTGKVLTGNLMTKADLKILRNMDFRGIVRASIWYLLLLVFLFICNRAQYLVLQTMGQKIIYTVRQEVFEHVLSLNMRFFDITPVGKIVTRVTNDVESLNEMYSNILVKLFKNGMMVIGIAGMMLYLNARMALYSFAMVPVVIVLTALLKSMMRKAYQLTKTRITDINTFLSENLSGMKLTQIFHQEQAKKEEFAEKSQKLYQANMREMLVSAVFRPSIVFCYSAALVIVILAGGKQVLNETITVGTFYIFINYVKSFFQPIQDLAEQFSTLQSAAASAEKICTILDEKPLIMEPENPVCLEEIKGRIEFDHVWFAYENEDYILRDVSFVIEPGQSVAFVGATGAGKSSILNLIGRYYDIQKGRILIDGVDIKTLSIEKIRSWIGQVQQDVFLFTGDVEGNIRLRDDSITDEKVREAANYVNASRFIEKLDHGYQEKVTERGATFSAGQRQLISFARTLAYDPKILILDEATANIDTETEIWIQEALEKLMNGRTTIMVAHRLSTIQHADQIIVMHKGKIRETGNHQELLKQNGIYKKLYELQLANS